MREENDSLKEQIEKLKEEINSFKKSLPQFRDAGVQVYLISQGKGSEGTTGQGDTLMSRFLDSVVTPFSFNR